MLLDEGSEPGLPQDVRQAGVAVQFVVALDQTLTLHGQAGRQETEIEVLSLVCDTRPTRIFRDRCHGFHHHALR